MHYASALRWAFKMWVCLRTEGSLAGQTVFKILQTTGPYISKCGGDV